MEEFPEGVLDEMRERLARAAFGKPFSSLSAAQKEQLEEALQEALEEDDEGSEDEDEDEDGEEEDGEE